ncbi:MAG: acyl-CoA dehydratase activase [Rhodospirillales bacterium]|jgi:predicted CoA-substrate-specific enzyme activase|nr:acyl-CoA dehydratase activase [Rhodospirillales bacterium]
MAYTIGLDVGSTYTKGLILDGKKNIIAHTMQATGARLNDAAAAVVKKATDAAGLKSDDIAYCITTGYGRHQYTERDLQVTDLTATARGTAFLFPGTRTVLDIGGQTMKASRIDGHPKVQTFRLNDKCASGTGMFLEKTVRYMGFETEDIGELLHKAEEAVPISGVCTVFAESEVINHLSNAVAPENIMMGAGVSLTQKSVQLLKRIQVEPEVTLVGGILRWDTMAKAISEKLGVEVNVAKDDMPQYTAALGCAILGHIRLGKIGEGQEKAQKAA